MISVPERHRPAAVLAGVGILSFLGCLDLTIVNTVAPDIARDLDASITQTQLVVNVFVVALSMFMVTAGRLSDRLGRRRVLVAGTALFAAGSLGAGLAASVPALVGFRFLQGAAGAVLYTSTSTIVAAAHPPERRGRAIGALFALNGIGLAAGPMLGGLVLGVASWHWVFLLNLPLIAVALAICAVSLDESRAEDAAGLDPRGAALLCAGIAGVVFALTFHAQFGWGSWPVVGGLVGGACALVAFALVDRRARDPLVPLRLLRNRRFAGAAVAELGLASFYTTALFLMPLYLEVVRGLGDVDTGLMLLPTTATVAVLSPFAGRAVDRLGPGRVIGFGFAAFAVSAALQASIDAGTPAALVVVAFAAMGVGWACVLGPAAVAALSAVPARLGGMAVGVTWTLHNLAGAVGLAAGVALFRAAGTAAVEDRLPAGVSASALAERPAAGGHGDAAATVVVAGLHATMLALVATSLAALAGVAWLRRPARERERVPAGV